MSSGGAMELHLGTEEVAEKKKGTENKDDSSEVVLWEKFLPRMVLRVLLVEADDSTRQIIAALLRKCGYRGHFINFKIFFVFKYMVVFMLYGFRLTFFFLMAAVQFLLFSSK